MDHSITLDIDKKTVQQESITIRIGEKGSCRIVATITKDGAPYTLTGKTARFECATTAKTMVTDAATTISGNTITYTLNDDIAVAQGVIKCAYFAIYQGNTVIETTDNMIIKVLANAESQSEGIGKGYISEIDKMLALLESARSSYDAAETLRASAEGGRVSAETNRKTAEVGRTTAETGRVNAEKTRVLGESTRASAESNRASAETSRVSTETVRTGAESTRSSNEGTRMTAEAARVAAEAVRHEAEGARLSAEERRSSAEGSRLDEEAKRITNEAARLGAEASRTAAETSREASETVRVDAESIRNGAETSRTTKEVERASAESSRVSAETVRVSAEGLRVTAEVDREAAEKKRRADFADIADAAQGFKTQFLSVDQYDESGIPTITGNAGIIYLVPNKKTENDNTYTEWMYLNDTWEIIGSTETSVSSITTNEIDSVVADSTPSGTNVLGLTGLSYLWSKIKAIFAEKVHSHNGLIPAGGVYKQALVKIGAEDYAVGWENMPSGIPVVTTEGTGSAYTVAVPEWEGLSVNDLSGKMLIINPHISSSAAPTIDVNGTGARQIKRSGPQWTDTLTGLPNQNPLSGNSSVLLLFQGNSAIALNFGAKPLGSTDFEYPVASSKGGVPAGGVKGQVLAKSFDKDYSTEWKSINGIPIANAIKQGSANTYAVSIPEWAGSSWKSHIGKLFVILPDKASTGANPLIKLNDYDAGQFGAIGRTTGNLMSFCLDESINLGSPLLVMVTDAGSPASTSPKFVALNANECTYGGSNFIQPISTSKGGVPTGGSTGQMLVKSSNTDYATKWADVPSGGSSGIPVATATGEGAAYVVTIPEFEGLSEAKLVGKLFSFIPNVDSTDARPTIKVNDLPERKLGLAYSNTGSVSGIPIGALRKYYPVVVLWRYDYPSGTSFPAIINIENTLLAYPIGSIYMTAKNIAGSNAKDPSYYFGGTWKEVAGYPSPYAWERTA